MPSAFVLLNCDPRNEKELIQEIRKVDGVKEVNGTYGVYDIIVVVESDNMEQLKEIVTWKIRKLDMVRSTVTLVVVEGQGE